MDYNFAVSNKQIVPGTLYHIYVWQASIAEHVRIGAGYNYDQSRFTVAELIQQGVSDTDIYAEWCEPSDDGRGKSIPHTFKQASQHLLLPSQ